MTSTETPQFQAKFHLILRSLMYGARSRGQTMGSSVWCLRSGGVDVLVDVLVGVVMGALVGDWWIPTGVR